MRLPTPATPTKRPATQQLKILRSSLLASVVSNAKTANKVSNVPESFLTRNQRQRDKSLT